MAAAWSRLSIRRTALGRAALAPFTQMILGPEMVNSKKRICEARNIA